jgi:hypothetical protein
MINMYYMHYENGKYLLCNRLIFGVLAVIFLT